MNDINTLAYHRGVRCDTDEWVYGYLLKRKDKTYIATQDNMDYMVVQDNIARLKLIEVIPETICAYSQVNDIDDIKIFDGDILETVAQQNTPFCKQTILFVEFVRGVFRAEGEISLESFDFRYCRVIGNFYDTPNIIIEHQYHALPYRNHIIFKADKKLLNDYYIK